MATIKRPKGDKKEPTKKLCTSKWTKFEVKSLDRISFVANNDYFDTDFLEARGADPITRKVNRCILPTLGLIEMLNSGKIRNLKISYDIYG